MPQRLAKRTPRPSASRSRSLRPTFKTSLRPSSSRDAETARSSTGCHQHARPTAKSTARPIRGLTMRKATDSAPKTLFLVKPSQPEPPAALVEEALHFITQMDRANFADHLETARTMWRKFRDLV